MRVIAISAVKRAAGSDDEGLDEIACLEKEGVRESCQNKKRETDEPDDDEIPWGDVSLCGPHQGRELS